MKKRFYEVIRTWTQLCRVGTRALPDNSIQRKISIRVNQLSIYIALINSAIGLPAYFFMAHDKLLLTGVVVEIMLSSIPIYLNYLRRYTQASWALYFILCGATFYFCCLLGNLANVDLMGIFLVATGLSIFAGRGMRIWSSIIAVGVVVGVHLNPKLGWMHQLIVDKPARFLLFYAAYTVVVFLVVSVVYWYGQVSEFLRKLRDEENRTRVKFLFNARDEVRGLFRTLFRNTSNLRKMLKHNESAEIEEGIDDLMASSKTTNNVIENIFEYELHKAGKLPAPDYKWINIRSILEEIVETHRGFADEKGVDLDLRLAPSLSDSIPCDKMKLRQIFMNLLHNAVKFTNENTRVKIEVSLTGCQLILSVTDSGDGIPKHIQHRIFEPFFTTNPHGLGLGLYIARELVSSFNGSIQITNNKTGGATVVATWPLPETAESYLNKILINEPYHPVSR